MKINRNNYEAFFLDYVEGRMDAEMLKELELFLYENPGLKKELENFGNLSLSGAGNPGFSTKDALKKNFSAIGEINELNYEEYFIAKIEGDLKPHESGSIVEFIKKNPFTAREFSLYEKVHLRPFRSEIFLYKDDLKRTAVISLRWKKAAAALALAASVLLLLVLNLDKEKRENISKNQATSGFEKAPIQTEKLSVAENTSEKTKKNINAVNIKKRAVVTEKKAEYLLATNLPELNTEKNYSWPDSNFTNANPVAEIKADTVYPSKIADESVEIYPDNINEFSGQSVVNKTFPETDEAFTLKEFLAFTFKKNVLKEKVSKKKKDATINRSDLLYGAIKGAARLFDSNLKVEKKNRDGEIALLSVKAPGFEISRTISR